MPHLQQHCMYTILSYPGKVVWFCRKRFSKKSKSPWSAYVLLMYCIICTEVLYMYIHCATPKDKWWMLDEVLVCAVFNQLQPEAYSQQWKKVFMNLYKQYVRPHLEFSVAAWAPWTQEDIETLEKVQKRAVKAVSGLKGHSYEEGLVELKVRASARGAERSTWSRRIKQWTTIRREQRTVSCESGWEERNESDSRHGQSAMKQLRNFWNNL